MATPETNTKPEPRQIAPEIKQNAEQRRVVPYEITPKNPTPQTTPKLVQVGVESVQNHGQEIFVQCLYMLPVVGNAMSLYDVGTDIYRICSTPGESKSFTSWGILAIDAIGVIPAAGNASRPARAIVKEVLLAFAKGAAASVLVDLFWATAGGDAIAFMEQLDEKLKGWRASIDSGIADASRTVRGFVENPLKAADQMGVIKRNTGFLSWVPTGEEIALHGIDELLEVSGQRETILKWLDAFDANRSVMLKQAFGDAATAGTLIFMAAQVVEEIKLRKARGTASHTANAASGTMHEPHVKPGEHRETTQMGAKASDLAAKDGCGCPVTASKKPVNYAMGDENLEQTDFALDGITPIVWTRRYRSSLSAYEASPLGARWTSPYHLSLEERDGGALTFFDPDARAVPLPAVAVGNSIEIPTEQFTISRIDARSVELAYPDGSHERYEQSRRIANSPYRLVARAGRDGLGLKFSYNEKNELSGITDGAQNAIRIDYENGHVATIYRIGLHGSRDEAIARYAYSPEGDLIEHRDVLDHPRKYTYQHHLLTRYVDFNGNPANLEWDALGRSAATSAQSRCVRTWIAKDKALDGEMNVHALAPKEDTRFEYHREHWFTKVTDADGNATIHRYDQHNRIVLVEHPDGTSESFNWNENNQLVSVKNALGQVQRFEYDDKGRVSAVTDALSQTTRTEYNDAGLPVKVTSTTGDVTTADYDALGRPVAVTDPAGRTTQYAWDSRARLIALTDPKGGVRRFSYDNGGRLLEATDCSNNATRYGYDERGYLSRLTDAEGNETSYRRDARGQIQSITRADGTVEKFTWDGNGNLLTYRDGAGTETRYGYDQLNQLYGRRTAAVPGEWGDGIGYHYDRQGRLIKLRNENDESTTFRYDALGQLIEQTGFDGRSVAYEWDDAGRLAASTEAGVETRYERDPMGRLTKRSIGKSAMEQFYYDARGRLVTAKSNSSVVRLHYDDADNLIAEEQRVHPTFRGSYSTVTRHEYDVLGNRTKTILPNTRTVDWLRYGSGHVHGVMLDGKPLVDFERDKLHREVKRTHRSFTQTRQYDPVGRLAQMSVRHATSANLIDVLARRKYQYSAAGNLTRIEDHTRGATDYTYDPLGRLLKSVTPDLTEVFAFDPAGNPVDPEKVPPRPVVETDEVRAARHAREDAEDEASKRAGQHAPMRWRRKVMNVLARSVVWMITITSNAGIENDNDSADLKSSGNSFHLR
ncbi:hypothetical protein BG58_09410 [Caballeronia jiangsuensis]|nr:hypothetical protein BG58_09410 [Caballeronia jiangsuensis]